MAACTLHLPPGKVPVPALFFSRDSCHVLCPLAWTWQWLTERLLWSQVSPEGSVASQTGQVTDRNTGFVGSWPHLGEQAAAPGLGWQDGR